VTRVENLDPVVSDERFVFVSLDEVPADVSSVAMVVEDEGTTLVVSQETADSRGFRYDLVTARITLRVHSDLAAVGLVAAVASVLARAGISCNVVAGYFHDHLFVPSDRADEAVELLKRTGDDLAI
jgi:uncharacterized protein